jgi:hypothetical protein
VTRNPDKPFYGPGETVVLTAIADSGHLFTGWSGALAGTQNPATVVINGNTSVSATFSPLASFSQWPVLASLPADRRGPSDRNGPLELPNLLAFAMGVDPLTATPDDLPATTALDPATGRAGFKYRRSKTATGVALTPMTSTSLTGWDTATITQTTVLQDGGEWEVVEIQVPAPPEGEIFFRLHAQ